MRKFLYLRIVASITLVTLLSYMIYFIYRFSRTLIWNDWMNFVLNELVFTLFITNSLSVLFIYNKYYPEKEISKASIRFYWFSFVFAVIWTGYMVLAFFLMLLHGKLRTDDGLDENERQWQMLLMLAIAFLLVVQLIGGRRMIKTIRQNARQQLENSFT